jgi:hypothetical protein
MELDMLKYLTLLSTLSSFVSFASGTNSPTIGPMSRGQKKHWALQ